MTNKEKFLAWFQDQVDNHGLVDFKPDMNVYGIAEHFGLGVKIAKVEMDGFPMPLGKPYLDFTNATVTTEDL